MLYRKLQHTGPILGSVLGALALTLLLDLQPALAEQARADASAEHDEHAVDHHEHHHHEVAPGYQRSLASYSVPAVTMVNQDGQRVDLPELLDADEPVMLNFIFTSCTAICPAMSAIFARVQTELGSDRARLRMVSISIDPEYDTPEVLKRYAEQFGAGPRWSLLTGDAADVTAALQSFDALVGSKMNHKPFTLFKFPDDARWVRVDGLIGAPTLAEEYLRLAGS